MIRRRDRYTLFISLGNPDMVAESGFNWKNITEVICDQNQKSCDMIHQHTAIKRYAARLTEANILNNPVRDSLGMYKVVKQKFQSNL